MQDLVDSWLHTFDWRAQRAPDLIRGFGLFNAPIHPRDQMSLRFWKAAVKFWIQSGYSRVNMTVPQRFAFSVADSPVGAAAWIGEKYRLWRDWQEDFEPEVFSKDELLTNVMLYWISNTFGTAIRLYWESNNHPWKVKPDGRIDFPTGVLSFPKDIVLLKDRMQQYYNAARFRYMERCGHCGIFEQAEEYANELWEFFRPLR